MFLFHWSVLLLVPGFILGLWAQHRVSSTFRRYARVPAANGLTGREMARRILDGSGLGEVEVERVPGQLSDHYDPVKRRVRLSEPVYGSSSVAALGVRITSPNLVRQGTRRLRANLSMNPRRISSM